MMKNILISLVILTLFILTPIGVKASGFNLQSIGSVNTEGKQISQWWYTASKPTFRGLASPGSEVTISIDSKPMVVAADSAGEWVYTPGEALSEGDHLVSLTNSGSVINFTLTIGSGNVDWSAVENGSASAMPAAGVTWPTILSLLAGGTLILITRKLLWTN